MKLYLHIGTEKTGSSFLQTYLSRNRDLLLKHNVYYPSAGRLEANMRKGLISPGNASDLEKLIESENWDKVQSWLANRKKEAEIANLETILLSNEILILRFAKQGVLQIFLKVLSKLDIECQGILLIIREPVSQALSLYKHRSKEGVLIPIEKWLRQKYIIADALKDFYKQLKLTDLKLTQYPYRKDSKYLVQVCLRDWLNIREEIKVKHHSVNPSLTLSELTLLCEIHKSDVYLSKKYYQFMLELEARQKSDDKFYKKYIRDRINNFMVEYNSLWTEVKSNMSIESAKYDYRAIALDEKDHITSFSQEQIEQISKVMNYSSSFKFKIFKSLIRLKKGILKITPRFVLDLKQKLYNER